MAYPLEWRKDLFFRPPVRLVTEKGGAFSLLELLITIALIFVMTTLLWSRGSRSYQQRQLAACQKNLESISVALNIYAADNKDFFPAMNGAQSSEVPLSLLVPRCTTVTEVFICPGTKDAALPEGQTFAERRISYAYYMGLQNNSPGTQPLVSDRQVDTALKAKGRSVFSSDGKSAGANHSQYGGNILFGDGHVESSSVHADRDLFYPTNVVLLNPRP